MTTSTLSLGLLLLLLAVLGAGWAGRRVMAGRAPAPAVASPSTPATPALAASTPAAASLAILATALRVPHGASPEELLAMLARDRAQPDLDGQLIDDDGYPVMAARSSGAVDALLQEEIGAWLAQNGMAGVAWSEEGWRALTLGTAALRELAHAAAAALAHDATLRLFALLPPQWNADVRHAATGWWQHLLVQCGGPAARLRIEQAQGSVVAILARLAQERNPAPAIVLACASHVGQETVDRWSAGGLLFRAAHPQGLVPGEGAAGLLLAGAAQAPGDPAATQLQLASQAREPAAAGRRRANAATLGQLAAQAMQGRATGDAIALVVADTGADTRQVLELMEFAGAAAPQLDDAGDVLRVGAACGACDAVPFIAALALARTAALERGAPVLCVCNEDPAARAVALVRPMA
jgi:hypothetical protein